MGWIVMYCYQLSSYWDNHPNHYIISIEPTIVHSLYGYFNNVSMILHSLTAHFNNVPIILRSMDLLFDIIQIIFICLIDFFHYTYSQLVLAASPLNTQHSGKRAKTSWLGKRIMCLSEVTCISVECWAFLCWYAPWPCMNKWNQLGMRLIICSTIG